MHSDRICPKCNSDSITYIDESGEPLYLYVYCSRCRGYMDREAYLLHREVIKIENERG